MNSVIQFELPEALIGAIAAQVAARIDVQPAASEWMDVDAAAAYLSTTPDALRKAVQRGCVPAHQPLGKGTRYLFSRAELDQWVLAI